MTPSESSYSPAKQIGSGLQPAFAWTAILGFAAFTGVLSLAGEGEILNIAFPAGSLAIGILLYFRAPILYVGFSWWIGLLAPLIRRLADYHSGFTDPSPILLAPYLVVLVTLITVWKNLPKAHLQSRLPFVLSLAGIFYGMAIGFILNPPAKTAVAALDWLTPVLFSFHLFVNWHDYPAYRQNLQRTLTWGVLVMGVYGVIQYLVAPDWDRFWLISAQFTTAGKPEPFGLRIWSTLASPEPFGGVMAGSLLILFTYKSVIRLPASIAGYLSFLLCAVRSGWLGWAAGLLSLVTALNAKLQMRLIMTILIMALCIIPLTTIEPFSQVIGTRLQTFSDIENDTSANERQATYQRLLGSALTSGVGEGISGQRLDSAILSMLLELGWLGTLFYLGGMLLLVLRLFQSSVASDPFIGTARAIVVSALIRFPLNIPMLGISGLLLWTFIGIGVAGLKYYQHQQFKNI